MLAGRGPPRYPTTVNCTHITSHVPRPLLYHQTIEYSKGDRHRRYTKTTSNPYATHHPPPPPLPASALRRTDRIGPRPQYCHEITQITRYIVRILGPRRIPRHSSLVASRVALACKNPTREYPGCRGMCRRGLSIPRFLGRRKWTAP